MRPAILIHGPTASGKTELAIQLAQELGGEIINADSMQVYRDLKILSARPEIEDLARAPHHMFGNVDGAVRYNTGQWLIDAKTRIEDIYARGKVPILAGGTGLYLSMLITGLSKIPDISEDNRQKAMRIVGGDREEALAKVREVDPVSGEKLYAGDGQRLQRVLEVYFETGQALSSFHTPEPPLLGEGQWIGFALTPIRQTLYERIEKRFDTMCDHGALEEIEALCARKLDTTLPVMRAHGVPPFRAYFEGRSTLEEAIEIGKRDTRRYAKRQFTWIANQFPTWPRIPSEDVDRRMDVIMAQYPH